MGNSRIRAASNRFASVARAFVDFADGAGRLVLRDRVFGARKRLLALVVAAAELPPHFALETSEGHAKDAPRSRPPHWKSFGRFESYWEVFDPYELEEPVAGSLSDDLLDIYSDVARGLSLHDRGRFVEAVWEWDFHFQYHWGSHAVDALRALQRACFRIGGR